MNYEIIPHPQGAGRLKAKGGSHLNDGRGA